MNLQIVAGSVAVLVAYLLFIIHMKDRRIKELESALSERGKVKEE